MGGPEISGIGFAIGEERLIILAEAEGVFDEYKPYVDAYVIDMTKGSAYALKIANDLRMNSYTTEINYYDRSMKSQFKSSDRKGARFVVIIGEDEMNKNTVMLKDTRTREQYEVNSDELVDKLDLLMEGEDE